MKAHEAPINLMGMVQQHTDYDYALVHHFDRYDRYYNFFKVALLNDREVILDNSIYELKKSFDPKQYSKWIDKLEPTYYIVPDVLEDSEETIFNFQRWNANFKNVAGLQIGTVQGTTYQEIVNCYKHMSENADYIAISFDMKYFEYTGHGKSVADMRVSGRIRLIETLISAGIWNWDKPHHLLGCSLAREFSYYKNNNIYNIRSVDTSNPVIAGLKSLKYAGNLGLTEEVHLADNEDFIDGDTPSKDTLDLIEYNMRKFNHILNP